MWFQGLGENTPFTVMKLWGFQELWARNGDMDQITMPHPDVAERERVLSGGGATVKSLVSRLTRQYRPLPGTQFLSRGHWLPSMPLGLDLEDVTQQSCHQAGLATHLRLRGQGGEVTVTVRGTVTDHRDHCLNPQVNMGLRPCAAGSWGRAVLAETQLLVNLTRIPGRGRLARTLCGDSPRGSGALSQTRVPAETPRVSEGNVPRETAPACRGGVQAGAGARTPPGAREGTGPG